MIPFYDDRAPPPTDRPRKLYRSKGKCPDCSAEDGEVHELNCPQPPRSGYIG